MDALTALALARIRETTRLPRRGRGGRMESATMAQARGAIDLEVWPESHRPGFALRQADVFQSYMAQ